VARHGYAADAPFIKTPRDARYHYSKRFGIDSSYRLSEQASSQVATLSRRRLTAADSDSSGFNQRCSTITDDSSQQDS
jgi:hypothetical protein